MPDAELVADICMLIAGLPTYGYRRVHALLRRQANKDGRAAPSAKRVYRVMKVHGLLLRRDGEHRGERRHDGQVAVDQRNIRWCSDGLEIACDNGEKVRVAFALDCCDREAMGHVATAGGITAEDVQDLMVATIEHRYGRVNRVPDPLRVFIADDLGATAQIKANPAEPESRNRLAALQGASSGRMLIQQAQALPTHRPALRENRYRLHGLRPSRLCHDLATVNADTA